MPMLVSRKESMSPNGNIRMMIDDDGDAHLSVFQDDGNGKITRFASVEICTPMRGGGGSSRTHEALLALAVAMAEDNADPMQQGRVGEFLGEEIHRTWRWLGKSVAQNQWGSFGTADIAVAMGIEHRERLLREKLTEWVNQAVAGGVEGIDAELLNSSTSLLVQCGCVRLVDGRVLHVIEQLPIVKGASFDRIDPDIAKQLTDDSNGTMVMPEGIDTAAVDDPKPSGWKTLDEDDVPDYEEIESVLRRVPMTWLPALLGTVVGECESQGVFSEGGLQRAVEAAREARSGSDTGHQQS